VIFRSVQVWEQFGTPINPILVRFREQMGTRRFPGDPLVHDLADQWLQEWGTWMQYANGTTTMDVREARGHAHKVLTRLANLPPVKS
jgi:hypothetical protein